MGRKREPRYVKPKRKKKEENMNIKKCPFCGSDMKCRGPKDSAGTIFWKCRNNKCGRTLDVRKGPPKEVIPLTYNGNLLYRGWHE